MNRKTIIIIISAVIVILLIIGGYLMISKKSTPTARPAPTFPGDSNPVMGGPRASGSGATDVDTFKPGTGAVVPRLYELHKLPVAGVGIIEDGDEGNLSVSARYIERGLGHIYETGLTTLVESRIVNETRSRISEALWGNKGRGVVIRFIDETSGLSVIKTSVLNIGGPSTSFERSTSTAPVSDFIKTEEVVLPDFIPFMSTADDGSDKIFYLENIFGSSAGSLSSFREAATSTVFNSAFTEWLPQLPNQQLATITTRPSAAVPGHLFFINLKSKVVSKVLGNINGLTTLTSRNGLFVLYSETKNGVPAMSVYDTGKLTSIALPIQTLPEKCVWGHKISSLVYCAVPQSIPNATYPDQWYQGVVGFSDSLWVVDTQTGATQKIMTPEDLRAPSIDIVNPSISSNDEYIVFMNKTTGTPWVYRVDTAAIESFLPVPVAPQAPVATSSPQGMTKIR